MTFKAGVELDLEVARQVFGFKPAIKEYILSYSTDNDAATRVLKHMESRGYYYSVSKGGGGKFWFAYFENAQKTGSAEQPTRPLAICLAALGVL